MRGATKASLRDLRQILPFQSTRPVRGATRLPCCAGDLYTCFNPRAPCGARRATPYFLPLHVLFQSTRPVRGATRQPAQFEERAKVSIHAPRAGRDRKSRTNSCRCDGFNPRAPCGARRMIQAITEDCAKFQSTRPVRGATILPFRSLCPFAFQSTRPVRGATGSGPYRWGHPQSFNPRAPCGARLFVLWHEKQFVTFQSTRPVRGATPEDALCSSRR